LALCIQQNRLRSIFQDKFDGGELGLQFGAKHRAGWLAVQVALDSEAVGCHPPFGWAA